MLGNKAFLKAKQQAIILKLRSTCFLVVSSYLKKDLFKSFYASGLFLYPLKTSDNQRFSDFFREYRKKPVP